MTITQTSLEAYQKISAHLSSCQMTVWKMLKRCPGGLTSMELSDMLHWSVNRVTPRVKELRDLGFIREQGIRKCRITGSNAAYNIALDEPPQDRLVPNPIERNYRPLATV